MGLCKNGSGYQVMQIEEAGAPDQSVLSSSAAQSLITALFSSS